MVKIKTISRSEKEFSRETKHDINKIHKNTDPQIHPLLKPREYQRALVATKIDKIFAQPFLGNLSGHSDAVSVLAKSQNNMTSFLSGSYDGQIIFWEISQRKKVFEINAHENMVKGITFSRLGQCFLSTGLDKSINLYSLQNCLNNNNNDIQPDNRFISQTPLNNVSHSYEESVFATAGQIVQIWSYDRSKPTSQIQWGADSITQIKFNPSEPHIICATGIDRSVILYDIRGNTPINRTFLSNKSNAICWNPQEPINFTVGNDDSNCYSFDMRKLDKIKMIHKDHIGPVMDIDYSPTGKEFVSGSYDKTIRIFQQDMGRSREVYHGKRLQKVFAVQWSMDSGYLLSGSDDMNIRLWKTVAYKPLGNMSNRHTNAYNQRQALKEKFKYTPEIRKIQKHRNLPKYIYNAQKKRQVQTESKHKKLKNQEINNASQFIKPKPERISKIQDGDF